MNDPGPCPKCGHTDHIQLLYSMPTQALCEACGERWTYGEGLRALSEEEAAKRRPGFPVKGSKKCGE